MTVCFDEESAYTRTKNVLVGSICCDIWPESNPFSHGTFGSCVMYYSGSTCSDMPPVETINEFIECLCESNE